MAHIKSVQLGGSTEYLIEPALYITPNLKSGSTNAYEAALSNFALDTGVIVHAGFSAANVANATLNVNSTGDKAIYYNGATIDANILKAGTIHTLMYDGTQWNVVGEVDSVKQEILTTSDSNNYPILLSHYQKNSNLIIANSVNRVQDIYVQPSTGTIFATTFYGAVTGNADTATSWTNSQSIKVDLSTIYGDGTNSTVNTQINGGQNTTQVIGIDGILGIPHGGTGTNTATAYGIPYANSTADAYDFTSAGTSGYILIGQGSNAAPTWQQILPVEHGGTGSGSFTDDCIIIPKTTNNVQILESRGLKVTGAVDNNIIIEPNSSNKTFTIQTTATGTAATTSNLVISSAFNLYINNPAEASTIFTTGGVSDNNEVMRVNTSGKVIIGKPNTPNNLTTDDLYVSGSVAFADQLKFLNTNAISHIDASGDFYINRPTTKIIVFQQNEIDKIQIDANNYFCPVTNDTLQIGDTNTRWKTAYFTTSLYMGSSSYTAENSNTDGVYIAPGKIAISKTTANDGLYLYGASQEYGHLAINTIGSTSVQGEARLTLGNNITYGSDKNAKGCIRLYNTDTHYADITATGWTAGEGAMETFTILGSTSNTADTAAYSTLEIGNNASIILASNAHSQGNIRLYSETTTYTDIRSQGTTASKIFYLPKHADDNMYAIHAGDNNAIGSVTQPVYIAENGRATVCDQTVGDAYTPVYFDEGVMTTVDIVQKINWSMENGNKSVKISVTDDNIFTTNSIVISIVVTSGGQYLGAPLTWKSNNKWVAINTSVAVTGAVSGYMLVVRGTEMADNNFTYTRAATEVS